MKLSKGTIKKTNDYQILILVALLLILIFRRLIPAVYKNLWIDEVDNFITSQNSIVDLLFMNHWDVAHPQLYFIILHFWQKLGTSELFLRIPGLIFSVFSGTLVYLIGRKVGGKTSGLIALFLYAYHPLFTKLDWQVNFYAPVFFLIFGSLLSFLNLERNEKWLAAFVIFNVLSFYTDYSAIWYFESLAILWLILFFIKREAIWFIKFTQGLILSFLLALPQIPIFIKNFQQSLGVVRWIPRPTHEILLRLPVRLIGWEKISDPKIVYTLFAISLITLGYLLTTNYERNKEKISSRTAFLLLLITLSILPPFTSYYFSRLVSSIFLARNLAISGFVLIFGLALFWASLFQKHLLLKFLGLVFLISFVLYSRHFSTELNTVSYSTIRNFIREKGNQSKLIVFLGEDVEWLTPLGKYYAKGYDGEPPLKNYRIVTIESENQLEDLYLLANYQFVFFFYGRYHPYGLTQKAKVILRCSKKYCSQPVSLYHSW